MYADIEIVEQFPVVKGSRSRLRPWLPPFRQHIRVHRSTHPARCRAIRGAAWGRSPDRAKAATPRVSPIRLRSPAALRRVPVPRAHQGPCPVVQNTSLSAQTRR